MDNKIPYIFHIGFNKCGSKSLNAALQILHIPSLHNSGLYSTIKYNILHNRKPFQKIDKKYKAFIDCINFNFHILKLVDEQYPNSKFILTVRPFSNWIQSRNRSNLIKKTNYVQKTEEQYTNNLLQVTEYFQEKTKQLLILRICEGEGWKELCSFLQLPIPHYPFPHLNKTIDN